MQTQPRPRDPALRPLPGRGSSASRPDWPGHWSARPAGPAMPRPNTTGHSTRRFEAPAARRSAAFPT